MHSPSLSKGIGALAILLLAMHLTPSPASAADGDLDRTFDPPEPFVRIPVIRSLVNQSDGSWLAGGDFDSFGDAKCASIIRFNPNGSVDSSFTTPWNSGSFPYLLGEIRSAVSLANGKILIGGNFTVFVNGMGDQRYNVALLNKNGSVDTGFSNALGDSGTVNALAVQSDGKILVGGYSLTLAASPPDLNAYQLVRLTALGAIDSRYPKRKDTGGYVSLIRVYTNETANTNRALIGGMIPASDRTSTNGILNLKSDGSELGGITSCNGAVLACAVQSDSKIVLGGVFTQVNGNSRNRLIRLNSDGSIDPSFNVGAGANAEVAAVAIQSDGKIVIAGGLTRFDSMPCGRLARLNSDGTLDAGFQAGSGANDRIFAMALTASGNILLSGAFTQFNATPRGGVALLNPDGSLQNTFSGAGAGNSAKTRIYAAAVQPDGKILVGGDFTGVGRRYLPGLARLLPDGSVDSTFDPGRGLDGDAQDISLQADGRILVGGYFGVVNGEARTSAARFHADGSVDPTFAPRVTRLDGSLATVRRICATDAQHVLILGHLRQVNGANRDYLARLSSNGELDATFNAQYAIQGYDAFSRKTLVGASPIPYAATVQPDGKTLVGGSVVWDGLARGYVLRLDAAGQLDPTFVPESITTNVVLLNGTAKQIRLTSGSQILVCGDFTEIRGHPSRPQRGGIARFGANGALDESFITRMGADRWIEDMALQPDGKILIAGWFKKYEVYDYPAKNNCIRVGRLLPEGQLDLTFSSGTGPDDPVYTVAWLPNSRALITGSFTNYSSVLRPSIARLFAATTNAATVPALAFRLASASQPIILWPTNAAGFVLETSDKLGEVALWQAVTQSPRVEGNQNSYTPLERSGQHYFRLRKP